jgi:hypothetical protein
MRIVEHLNPTILRGQRVQDLPRPISRTAVCKEKLQVPWKSLPAHRRDALLDVRSLVEYRNEDRAVDGIVWDQRVGIPMNH